MAMTTRYSKNPMIKQTNLAAGMAANTVRLWSGIFWATANMNWRLAERSIGLTGQLLDANYQAAVQSLAGATVVLAHGSIDFWKNSLGMLNTGIKQSQQLVEQGADRLHGAEQATTRRTRIFSPEQEERGRTQIFPQEREVGGRTQIFPQEREVGGRTQIFPQEREVGGRAQIFSQPERSPHASANFAFRGPENQHDLQVYNLEHFVEVAQQVDDPTWQYHFSRGDYSHWFRTALQDEELAAATMRLEKQDVSAQDSREQVLGAIRSRYNQ